MAEPKQLTNLPIEIKRLILRQLTAGILDASYLSYLTRTAFPVLDVLEGHQELITTHFRREAEVYSPEYAIAEFQEHRDQHRDEQRDPGVDFGATDAIKITTHLRWLVIIAIQVRSILDKISRLTGVHFSEVEYSTMLRLFYFLGHRADQWSYVAHLTEKERAEMDTLLDKICDAIAYRFRDNAPQDPVESNLVFVYNSIPQHQVSEYVPFPWSNFTRCGLYATCLKHWLLSLTSIEWFEFWCFDRLQTVLMNDSAWWMMRLNETRLRIEFDDVGKFAIDYGDHMRAVPPTRSPKNDIDPDSVEAWAEINALAAWNLALHVARNEDLLSRLPGNPEYNPNNAKISNTHRLASTNVNNPLLAQKWRMNQLLWLSKYKSWPAPPMTKFVWGSWFGGLEHMPRWYLGRVESGTWLQTLLVAIGATLFVLAINGTFSQDSPITEQSLFSSRVSPALTKTSSPVFQQYGRAQKTISSRIHTPAAPGSASTMPAMTFLSSYQTQPVVSDSANVSPRARFSLPEMSPSLSAHSAKSSIPTSVSKTLDPAVSTGSTSTASIFSAVLRPSSQSPPQPSPSFTPPSLPLSNPSSAITVSDSRFSHTTRRPDDVYLLVDKLTCSGPVQRRADGTLKISDGTCNIDSSSIVKSPSKAAERNDEGLARPRTSTDDDDNDDGGAGHSGRGGEDETVISQQPHHQHHSHQHYQQQRKATAADAAKKTSWKDFRAVLFTIVLATVYTTAMACVLMLVYLDRGEIWQWVQMMWLETVWGFWWIVARVLH
ncbi:hypothetical protein MBLNU459_g0620t1 [Dothideomycetes sp. NU459]